MASGFQLTSSVVEEIQNFAQTTPCYGDRRKNLGFYYADRQQAEHLAERVFSVGHFFNVPLRCPAVEQLGKDPLLLAIATEYLQGPSVHQGSQLWWTFAKPSVADSPKGVSGQAFHYDLDDSHSIKFFFYLSDVDCHSGAHVYFRGSHLCKQGTHQWKRRGISETELTRMYGADTRVAVEGKAGYGFVEDTYCFHRGTPCFGSDRLLLTVQFALRDYDMQNSMVDPGRLSLIPGYEVN
ncbi:phytanoyl-CoA dioxygenase family protein [Leptolyngbya sp. AN02str]|uniref:phytanoyl-CoA dioxygenase family protein n=1 Tax=Leptolyngbya sp. AN02str TaxID=3423363 RepID=UPI003D3189C6